MRPPYVIQANGDIDFHPTGFLAYGVSKVCLSVPTLFGASKISKIKNIGTSMRLIYYFCLILIHLVVLWVIQQFLYS